MTRELHDKLKRELVLTAIVDVETEAKLQITEDEHIDTGRLRASIHTEYKNHVGNSYADESGNTFSGSLRTAPRNDLDVIVGTNVSYAQKIERLDSYLMAPFERAKPKLERRLRNILDRM